MALYRLSIKIVKDHISAKVAYIEREGKYSKGSKAEELRENWSSDMPNWAATSQDFWKAIENGEKPGNVQARGIELALPVELSQNEQKELINEFCDKVLSNHAKTIAIHDDKNGKNPHVHIYFTERVKDNRPEPTAENYCKKQRGYKKDEQINGKNRTKWLKNARKTWEIIQNKALERAGRPERVSCLSLEEQGEDREAQIHVGFKEINKFRRTGQKGERYKRNEAIIAKNRSYIAEKKRLEEEIAELEKKAIQEQLDAKRAEEQKREEEKNAAWLAQCRQAAALAELQRRAAENKAKKEEKEEIKQETAADQTVAATPAPEPENPPLWLSDEQIKDFVSVFYQTEGINKDKTITAAASALSDWDFNFKKLYFSDFITIENAVFFIKNGYARRGSTFTSKERAKRRLCNILREISTEKVRPELEKAEPQREETEKKPEQQKNVVKVVKKERDRGFSR